MFWYVFIEAAKEALIQREGREISDFIQAEQARTYDFAHLIVSLISSISLFSQTSTWPVRKQWLTNGTS